MSDPRMRALTQGLPTKSAKIRKLGAAGYTRQQIADFLGIRYQHVRNVLLDAERKAGHAQVSAEPDPQPLGFAEEASPPDSPRAGYRERVRVNPDGSLLLPASLVAAAGLSAGTELTARVLDDGHVELISPEAGLKRARAILRKYVPPGVSLVDEFIEEKRREVAREREREAEYEREMKEWRTRK
jgi:hypothetical protein